MITDGHGSYRWNGGRRSVSVGDLLVVVPGEPHSYGPPPGAVWNEAFLTASGPIGDALARSVAQEDHVLTGITPALRHRFATIADRFIADGMDRGGVLLAELHGLLASHRAAPPSEADSWLTRAQAILGSQPERSVAAAEAAALVHMPYRTFRRVFKARTGLSPAAYRLHCRLAAARRMLVEEPGLDLSSIAAATGFCSPFQLSRMYRRHYGRPPGADRV